VQNSSLVQLLKWAIASSSFLIEDRQSLLLNCCQIGEDVNQSLWYDFSETSWL